MQYSGNFDSIGVTFLAFGLKKGISFTELFYRMEAGAHL
jgi:hypothetical protein